MRQKKKKKKKNLVFQNIPPLPSARESSKLLGQIRVTRVPGDLHCKCGLSEHCGVVERTLAS